ncbi:MAG: ABC transporter permease subunit, partial [Gammaproteobacteria bacterium]|nr:ABC transporter permease subunit [Gammaproteobacteria bacterium]
VSWLALARIVRGQTLAAKNEAYVEAARAMGVGTPGILKRHIVPNIIGTALVYATLTVPGVIIAESFLSFLGLGVQEPQTSWGVLIADGAREMRSSPWQLAFPATMLAVTLFALNVLGDRLRDALDRRSRS